MKDSQHTLQTLFLALSSFTNISNILRGNLICSLAERYRIIVLTPYLDSERAKRDGYFLHKNIYYINLSQKYLNLWGFSNKYFRVPFIREYDEMLETRVWEYRKILPWRARVLITIGKILPRRFPNASFFTWIEKCITRPSKEFMELVKSYEPQLLITATPGFSYAPFEAEMLVFAKTLGIRTVAIDTSFDNPYSQAKFTRKTDYILVWNDRMKRETQKFLHYPNDKITVVGCLKFDHYFSDIKSKKIKSREAFLKSKNLNPQKKLVVYATPTPGTYPPRKELMEKLVTWKKENSLCDNPNILVRLHPIDVWEPYEEFRNIPEIHIERAGQQNLPDTVKDAKVEMREKDLINLTETLLYADVFINFASTMIVEACIFSTPSVSIAFPKQQRPFVDFELTKDIIKISGEKLAKNPKELLSTINALLTVPQTDADIERDKKTLLEFVQFTDGVSWKRVADCIDAIINTLNKQ